MKEGFEERSEWERVVDEEYVGGFLDPAYLGEKLGEGMRVRVYQLKDGFEETIRAAILDPRKYREGTDTLSAERFVIKIPQTNSLIPPEHAGVKFRHFRTAIAYFGEYVTNPSYVLRHSDGKKQCVIQRQLEEYAYISPENMHLVSEQLEDFFAKHRRYAADGYYMDVLGKEGIIACTKALVDPNTQPFMTNLVIERSDIPRLQAPDVSARDTRKEGIALVPEVLWKKGFFEVDKQLVRHHFGLDMGTLQ